MPMHWRVNFIFNISDDDDDDDSSGGGGDGDYYLQEDNYLIYINGHVM